MKNWTLSGASEEHWTPRPPLLTALAPRGCLVLGTFGLTGVVASEDSNIGCDFPWAVSCWRTVR